MTDKNVIFRPELGLVPNICPMQVKMKHLEILVHNIFSNLVWHNCFLLIFSKKRHFCSWDCLQSDRTTATGDVELLFSTSISADAKVGNTDENVQFLYRKCTVYVNNNNKNKSYLLLVKISQNGICLALQGSIPMSWLISFADMIFPSFIEA